MKRGIRGISAVLVIIVISSFIGCNNKQSNPIVGKIYWIQHTSSEKIFNFDFVKFYDDNTFQSVEVKSTSNLIDHYGTYEIDKNTLTLKISDKNFSGVILNNGDSLQFDNIKFIDYTEHIKPGDSLLSKFR